MLLSKLQPVLAIVTTVSLLLSAAPATADSSDKRGLCHVPSEEYPEDDRIWVRSNSSLTWYYNYEPTPAAAYADIPQNEFEFVPMFWGAPLDTSSDTFYQTIKNLIESEGRNITHVLGFNEPDGSTDYGGSDTAPAQAAAAWATNMVPIKEEFPWIRLGLPACTAAWGWVDWLREFLDECAEIVHEGERNCTFDFLPLHWYDNFEGLASHMGVAQQLWVLSMISQGKI